MQSRTSRWVALVVATALVAACGGDPDDEARDAPNSSAATANSVAPVDLLIDATTDIEGSGRPVVLWFWAPG
jgi:ABC-type glycerol-3-phosphate transport system substrate-binding protein